MDARPEPVTVVIFEGGRPRGDLAEQLAAVRRAVVLDTIETIQGVPEIEEVILGTDLPDLAREAASLGARVDFRAGEFHFGRRLLEVARRYRVNRLIYLGGPAAPLFGKEDWRFLALLLKSKENVVAQNNPQSPDVIAFAPARALEAIPCPASDNELGFALRDLGLERILLPNSARVNFDLDTPADALVLKVVGKAGPRAARVLAELDWDDSRLREAQGVLSLPGAEVVIAGRVGPAVVNFLNANLALRVRVFSEERGMKALGRQRRREVVSLLGFLWERVGGREFFSFLARCAQAVFLDSRVLFAHWRRRLTDEERFASDLGKYGRVRDPLVAEFTRAAIEAPVPVVLGGHCLVSGGIWLLAEDLLEKGYAVRPLVSQKNAGQTVMGSNCCKGRGLGRLP